MFEELKEEWNSQAAIVKSLQVELWKAQEKKLKTAEKLVINGLIGPDSKAQLRKAELRIAELERQLEYASEAVSKRVYKDATIERWEKDIADQREKDLADQRRTIASSAGKIGSLKKKLKAIKDEAKNLVAYVDGDHPDDDLAVSAAKRILEIIDTWK